MVLPADESVAGRVNDRVTGVLAWPVTSKRPPFVRSVALIGVWTLAVAVMLALFDWAWSAVPVRTRAATARDSFEMLRIKHSCVWCRAFSRLECHSAPPAFWSAVRARLMPSDNFLISVNIFDAILRKTGSQHRTSS